jgi:ribose-phosphate pyrophosphokinase
MVMDLHADQIQGFFNIPVDNIYATPYCWAISGSRITRTSSWSPDVAASARPRDREAPDSDLAIIDKRRPRANVAER